MMKEQFIGKRGVLCRAVCLGGCAAIFSMGALFPLVAMPRRAGPKLRTLEPTRPGDPGTPHASIDRNGAFETKDGLTLRLSADLGSVRIVSLETGSCAGSALLGAH